MALLAMNDAARALPLLTEAAAVRRELLSPASVLRMEAELGSRAPWPRRAGWTRRAQPWRGRAMSSRAIRSRAASRARGGAGGGARRRALAPPYSASATRVPCSIARLASSSSATSAPPISVCAMPAASSSATSSRRGSCPAQMTMVSTVEHAAACRRPRCAGRRRRCARTPRPRACARRAACSSARRIQPVVLARPAPTFDVLALQQPQLARRRRIVRAACRPPRLRVRRRRCPTRRETRRSPDRRARRRWRGRRRASLAVSSSATSKPMPPAPIDRDALAHRRARPSTTST